MNRFELRNSRSSSAFGIIAGVMVAGAFILIIAAVIAGILRSGKAFSSGIGDYVCLGTLVVAVMVITYGAGVGRTSRR